MSAPLLLERTIPGKGPKVPTQTSFNIVVVEGLMEGDSIALFVDYEWVDGFTKDGVYNLDPQIEKSRIVQAELLGNKSKASVRLEYKKWA